MRIKVTSRQGKTFRMAEMRQRINAEIVISRWWRRRGMVHKGRKGAQGPSKLEEGCVLPDDEEDPVFDDIRAIVDESGLPLYSGENHYGDVPYLMYSGPANCFVSIGLDRDDGRYFFVLHPDLPGSVVEFADKALDEVIRRLREELEKIIE